MVRAAPGGTLGSAPWKAGARWSDVTATSTCPTLPYHATHAFGSSPMNVGSGGESFWARSPVDCHVWCVLGGLDSLPLLQLWPLIHLASVGQLGAVQAELFRTRTPQLVTSPQWRVVCQAQPC